MSENVQRADFGPVTVYYGTDGGKYPDGNQVIVRGTRRKAVFDSPLVANRIGADFDTADLVILGHVHEDHVCGLHRLPRAPVHVHAADLDAARSWEGLARHYGYDAPALERMRGKVATDFHWVPRPDAVAYDDGASWDLGDVTVRAIHLPGHTAGHCALLVEPAGIVFIGDIDLSGFGPYYGDATSTLVPFRRSLERVASIPASTWITSHHKGVYTDRGAFLRALAAFAARIDERAADLLGRLAERPRTLAELVAGRLMYRPDSAGEVWLDSAERRAITLHLDELVERGRVVVLPDRRFAAA